MAFIWIPAGAATFVAVLVRLIELIRTDGYGVRPPPTSHLDWDAGPDARLG